MLFLETLAGKAQARMPIWLMRQAGRYLPEYRALRVKAKNFLSFCYTPELAIEATLQPIKRFGFDAAILFSDILVIPDALGVSVRFVENEGPLLEPVTADVIGNLSPARVREHLANVFEAVRGIRAALPRETALIGFAGAPWTVATYMIEGRGGTDHEKSRALAAGHPELFAQLMGVIEEATIDYLLAQVEAGVNVLQLFDSWASSVPQALRRQAIFEPTARIVSAVKVKAPQIPIIGFPRGIGLDLARYVAATGVDAVSLDQSVDIVTARNALGRHVVTQGNLDPVLLADAPEAAMVSARAIMAASSSTPHVFNLGHGILPRTPIENVERLVATLRGGA